VVYFLLSSYRGCFAQVEEKFCSTVQYSKALHNGNHETLFAELSVSILSIAPSAISALSYLPFRLLLRYNFNKKKSILPTHNLPTTNYTTTKNHTTPPKCPCPFRLSA
jgi:hypothetical protein